MQSNPNLAPQSLEQRPTPPGYEYAQSTRFETALHEQSSRPQAEMQNTRQPHTPNIWRRVENYTQMPDTYPTNIQPSGWPVDHLPNPHQNITDTESNPQRNQYQAPNFHLDAPLRHEPYPSVIQPSAPRIHEPPTATLDMNPTRNYSREGRPTQGHSYRPWNQDTIKNESMILCDEVIQPGEELHNDSDIQMFDSRSALNDASRMPHPAMLVRGRVLKSFSTSPPTLAERQEFQRLKESQTLERLNMLLSKKLSDRTMPRFKGEGDDVRSYSQ